jgi:beta-lactamase class D
MKKLPTLLTILALLSVLSCHDQAGRKGNMESVRVKVPVFQAILDSAEVSGAILVFDPAENTYYSNDFDWCATGHLPASTFKIPNTIIALETGVMASDSAVIKWDGEKRRLKEWERDLTLRDAFHVSCVPCYQVIARSIGVERMNDYLSRFEYGLMVVDSASIDRFWLEGDSKISQFEQIGFLLRFYNSGLPISKVTESTMKRLMVIEESDTLKLSGKTGWSIRNGNNNGWFVGYAGKGEKVFFFATNINPNVGFNMDLFPLIRKEITLKALETLL